MKFESKQFSFTKIHLKRVSVKCWPFCFGIHVQQTGLFESLSQVCCISRAFAAEILQSCMLLSYKECRMPLTYWYWYHFTFNTMKRIQNGCHFPNNIFKYILFNENVWISIKSSLKFVHKGSINNIPALVQIMAWHWSSDKPLSELMMVSLLTHLCITRPQWVNLDHAHYEWRHCP